MRRLITGSYYRTKTMVVDRLRRGDRTVLMPPAGTRFGNLLYMWLQADIVRRRGIDAAVLSGPRAGPWLTAFPDLRPLAVELSELRFHDRREWDPQRGFYQRFGTDFTREDLLAFIAARLAPALSTESVHPLVINVRRGDYYSDARFRGVYGIDVVDYLKRALDAAGGLFDRPALVVSDDTEWCRDQLHPLLTRRTSRVIYAGGGPASDFQAICRAQLLIGTNSTFSYWGGYVSAALVPGARVIMPSFHSAEVPAHQLDPRWTVLAAHPLRDP